MTGNRRDTPRIGDQPDWDSCIAWRRMLTAVVNVEWDFMPAAREIRDWLVEHLHLLEGPLHRDNVLYYLEEAEPYFGASHPYGACYYALEALAQYRGINGPDRVEIVGQELCAIFQKVYPVAPPGFERTGRMRQKPGGEQPLWVEPLRDFITRHRIFLGRDQIDA